jgi:FlaA1/EpsC-like NDP-sugar epimerase
MIGTVDDAVVLITGGTGSLGQTLTRRLLAGGLGRPKRIIVFSRDEAKQYAMKTTWKRATSPTDDIVYHNFDELIEFRIGDVRDYGDVCSAVKDADIVINAAALKQVPTCEYFPAQAILTNCLGAANIARAIEENGYPVGTVVGISTDKACKPVNVMGMTKSLQERIFIAANVLNQRTRFICVRYGNVLASRGSVVPLFHNQIRNGGPVTITDPKMTRFLLPLDQAVDTVFAALRGAKAGETFIPRAPSASVANIAKALIGSRKIAIRVTGVRPGEKLHEIMVSEEEVHHCVRRGDYYAIRPMLPELRGKAKEKNALSREFSSAGSVMSLAATATLLRRNRLMVDDRQAGRSEELLR